MFSLYRGLVKCHENTCKQREEQRRLEEGQIWAAHQTPIPKPYTPIASSPESESELEVGSGIIDVAVDDCACSLTLLCHYYIHWSIGDVITSSTWDTGPNAQLQIQDSPPRTPTPLPYTNPLIIDPLLKTTPPPSDPHDEFGISTVPKCEGLSTLQPGQTLIVYHPFAQHPPEVIDTAKLTLA